MDPRGNSRSIVFAPVSSDVESANIPSSDGESEPEHAAEARPLKEK